MYQNTANHQFWNKKLEKSALFPTKKLGKVLIYIGKTSIFCRVLDERYWAFFFQAFESKKMLKKDGFFDKKVTNDALIQ